MKSKNLICFVAGVLLLCLCVSSVSANDLHVGSRTMNVGDMGGITLYLDDAPSGISQYDITIHISNPEHAEIIGFGFPGWEGETWDYGGKNDRNVGATGDILSGSNIYLGYVVIHGIDQGSTAITVTVNSIVDNGEFDPIPDVVVVPGQINVMLPPTPVHNLRTLENFATIQEAIDAPLTQPGDTITVDYGWYDKFTVNKPLTIQGIYDSVHGFPVVEEALGGNAIEFTSAADGVILDGFQLIGYGSSPDGIGVYIPPGSESNVLKNIAMESFYDGIFIENADNNRITSCTGEENIIGIYLNNGADHNTIDQCTLTRGYYYGPLSTEGVNIVESNYNTVQHSTISGMTAFGIGLGEASTFNFIFDNSLTNNDLVGHSQAINLDGHDNGIFWNRIMDNYIGIDIYEHGVDNNIINNYFKQDESVGSNVHPYAGNANSYNNPIEGNYWANTAGNGFSDTCDDVDYNGICDDPYEIAPPLNIDFFPLSTYSFDPIPGIAPSPGSGNAPLEVHFYDYSHGFSPPITYSWSFGDGGSSSDQNPTHTYTSSGNYRVDLTVSDADHIETTFFEFITVGGSAPEPTVTSVYPPSGPATGDTTVSISGSGFTGATAVTFGGTAAMSFSVTDDSTIVATTPAHAAGAVNVVVTTPGGTGTGAYTYEAAAATGSIAVTSDPPGAAIYLDGSTISSGPTPATLTGISVGPHTVNVTLTGYFDVIRPVTVVSGGTATVSAIMDEIPAVLTDKAKEAVQATMTNVLMGDTSGKVVYVFNTDTPINNPEIDQWQDLDPVSFDNPGVISYVDPLPEANHAKEGLFVNTYTDPLDGIIKTETKISYSPATKINGNTVVCTHGAGKQPSPGVLGIPNDPKVWAPQCTVNCDNYYALLISGGTDREHNEVRYWNDISYMYNVLIENDYKPGNIKVLVSDGANTYKDRHIKTTGVEANDYDNSPLDLTYPADGYNDVNDAATKQKVLDYLRVWENSGAPAPTTPLVRSSLTSGKSLLIFTTSHGSKISGTTKDTNQVNLNLWNAEAISDAEFAAELARIDAGNITVVMEQCNGGGFYDNWIKGYSGTQKRTLITAADWYEPSWGNGFADAWTSGVAGHLRGATSDPSTWDKSADVLTSNDRVSLQESKDYVLTIKPGYTVPNDPYAITGSCSTGCTPTSGKEHPQIFSAPTSNVATARYLNDCTGTLTGSISSVSPTTPSTWKQGSHQIISWIAKALPGRMVKVELYKSGSTTATIVSCSPGVDAEKTTSVGWDVPSGTGAPSGTGWKIRVQTCTSSPTLVTGTSAGTINVGAAVTGTGTATFNINPTDGIKIFWDGTQISTSATYTQTDTEGTYFVRVTKDGYYPYDAKVTITSGQNNALAIWNLLAKPTGANGEDLDPAPEGGILVNADHDPALVWTCKYDTCDPRWSTCAHPTNCEHSPNVETPNIEKRLVAGFSYDVYVTKDGFLPSEKQTVYIEQPYPYRVLVPLYFTLTQKPEVPAKVLIVPNPLNIGRTGYFLAIVRLPDGYKAADVDAGSVYCEGAKALKLVRINLFPRIFVGIFSRQDLGGSTGTIQMNVWGLVKKNSEYVPFRGSDTVTVINKKVTTKEDVDNVMTMTDTQIFTKFNKF